MTVVGTGPVEVQAVCAAVLGELAGAFPSSEVSGSVEQWAGVLGSLQRVIDTACAVQDAAIVRLAAIEPAVLEDGTLVETHRALGHAALDTPAIVSGVLNVAPVHAESRVRAALALAADGPPGTPTATGLGGLHTAMATGALDTYRAGVIAQELAEAPPQVAATVVAALEGHFACEDAAHLRRRCRRVLARISPDLLGPARPPRPRTVRAAPLGRRTRRGQMGRHLPLRGRRPAWAAIDALAHQYLTAGTSSTIERARAQALTDLVTGNATITTMLTLTVPATVLPQPMTPEPTAPEATGPRSHGPRGDGPRGGRTRGGGSRQHRARRGRPGRGQRRRRG